MRLRTHVNDHTKEIVIPYKYNEDGTLSFFLTEHVLHAVTIQKNIPDGEKLTYSSTFKRR
jgi:hypothetical protein